MRLKKNNKIALLAVLAISFASLILISQVSFAAKELENTYPKIPLSVFGNFSLNDIRAVNYLEECTDDNEPIFTPCPFPALEGRNTLALVILYIFSFAISIAGLAAFGVVVWAGLLFLTSGANPSARKQAQDKLKSAILGIILLLGSYLLLNTINPELTRLRIPPISPGDFSFNLPGVLQTPVDEDSIIYGGVVLYGDNVTDGSSGKSEAIFGDIKNMANSGWVDNNTLSGVKILGNCAITIYENANFNNDKSGKSLPLGGPGNFTDTTHNIKGYEVSSIFFHKKDCLGKSLRAYASPDFTGGSISVLYELPDLQFDILRPSGFANDSIWSIQKSRDNLDDFSFFVCTDAEFNGTCANSTSSVPDASTLGKGIAGEISSIRIEGNGLEHQGGVVLYTAKNFEGLSEIFISSDFNIDAGNVTKTKTRAALHGARSLKIVGKYKIILRSEILRSEGTEMLEIDNSQKNASFTSSAGEQGTIQKSSSGALEIPDFSMFKYNKDPSNTATWDAYPIKSLEIYLPKEIYENQGFGDCPDEMCLL